MMAIVTENPNRDRALELARTTDLTRAAIAREVGEPYSRVYKWLYRVQLHRDELAAERIAEQRAKIERDRERLTDLLDRYRRGELVHGPPWWTIAEAGNAVLDVMNDIAGRVEKLVERSQLGEPMTEDEREVLGLLDMLAFMRRDHRLAFDEAEQ